MKTYKELITFEDVYDYAEDQIVRNSNKSYYFKDIFYTYNLIKDDLYRNSIIDDFCKLRLINAVINSLTDKEGCYTISFFYSETIGSKDSYYLGDNFYAIINKGNKPYLYESNWIPVSNTLTFKNKDAALFFISTFKNVIKSFIRI